MKKKINAKLIFLSLTLIIITIIIKLEVCQEEVMTLSINSSYTKKIRLANNILDEKRELVYIDRRVKVNPVVYELQLLSYKNNKNKTDEYFIKKYIRDDYIREICKCADIDVSEEEIEKYKEDNYRLLGKSKKDRLALFNGYRSFNEFMDSEETICQIRIEIKKDKLEKLSTEELAKHMEIENVENTEFEEILARVIEEKYLSYKNKNRY